jgi:hypothetical protein
MQLFDVCEGGAFYITSGSCVQQIAVGFARVQSVRGARLHGGKTEFVFHAMCGIE